MRPSCISAAARSWRRTRAAAGTTLATAQGFVQWVARGTVLHGWAWPCKTQSEASLRMAVQGLATELATGSTLYQPYFLGLLAGVWGRRTPRRGVGGAG